MARPTQAQIAAAEAAAEESAAMAVQDAANARAFRLRGDEVAQNIRRLNAANHFSRWLFRDAAGGDS